MGCATAPLQAQVDDKEKAEQEAAKQRELEKNTLKLLDAVISDAAGLKLRENRAYVLTSAADTLWRYDEKRARALFWEALAALDLPTYQEANQSPIKDQSPIANQSPINKETSSSGSPGRANGPTTEQLEEELNKYYAKMNTRNDFLHKVARHDAQLALDMMRSTRQPPPPSIPGIERFDPDVNLEQELAYAAAANDPRRSLQMARESLARGLTYQVLNLLRDINQRDQETGSQLAGDIIAKLQTENLTAANSYAPFLAVNLLQSSRAGGGPVLAGFTEGGKEPNVTRLKLDDHQKQDLVFLLTDAALTASSNSQILQAIRIVMPEIEQYASDRLPKLKTRMAEYERTLPSNLRDWDKLNAQLEKATPEEMIKAANKVSEEQRNALFYQAASKAVASGEADRYRELLNNLSDETQRKAALDALNNQQMYDDLARGKTDDLEKIVALIRVKEQRAMAMAHLALMLEKKDQHDAAVKLLDEARGLVKVDLGNEAQSNALLEVLLSCALIDPGKAFAMIEPVIDHTNEEISKLALADKIIKTGAIKNGEILMNQPQLSLDYSIMKYSAGLVALGKADFDRTRALAERFQRNELKVAARLLIVKAMLRVPAQVPSPGLRQ
jgi:hypothetical protein